MRTTSTESRSHWMDDASPVPQRFAQPYRFVQVSYMEARARSTTDAEQRTWRRRSDASVGFLDALDPGDFATMLDAVAVLEGEYRSVRDEISSQLALRLR